MGAKIKPKTVPTAVSRENRFLTPNFPSPIGLLFRFGLILEAFWEPVFASFSMFFFCQSEGSPRTAYLPPCVCVWLVGVRPSGRLVVVVVVIVVVVVVVVVVVPSASWAPAIQS